MALQRFALGIQMQLLSFRYRNIVTDISFSISAAGKQWKTPNKEQFNEHNVIVDTDLGVCRNSLSCALKNCSDSKSLDEGRKIHTKVLKYGFDQESVLGNKLLNMYAKCGCMEDACQVFDKMSERNVVGWTALIVGYVQQDQGKSALEVFGQMQEVGIDLDAYVFTSVFRACGLIGGLEEGKQVHSLLTKTGLEEDVYVGSALVDMYVKCGELADARCMFDKMPERNVVSWTTMIAGYGGKEASRLFYQMLWEDVRPEEFVLASVLSACSEAMHFGKQVHSFAVKIGVESFVCVFNSLVNMYAKCGHLEDAFKLFDRQRDRNLVSYTSMICGYAQQGCKVKALMLFCQMQGVGIRPDEVVFASVLWACIDRGALEHGKQLHGFLIRNWFDQNFSVRTALVTMYIKCGRLEYSRLVFDKTQIPDVTSWSAIIARYLQDGHCVETLKLFSEMQGMCTERDELTFASALWACASLRYAQQGKEIHAQAMKFGLEIYSAVGNALVSMYAKCGSIKHARLTFDKIRESERNVVSWGVMTAEEVHCGNWEEALRYFYQMLRAGIKPDQFVFTCVFRACTGIQNLDQGKKIRAHIMKLGFESVVCVGSAIIDMYARCGSLDDARQVFNQMSEQNLISWTTMICGYAQNGRGIQALKLFEEMVQTGPMPDHITFVGVLSACSHAGLVEEGFHYFQSMSQDYHVTPTMEHYACMVDLLGRAGWLDQAEDFINKMPLEPDAVVWGAFLSACKIHGNFKRAKHAAERLLYLEPQCAGAHVLLSNMYVQAGMWDDAAHVRKLIKDKGLLRQPGCSWIQVKDEMYTFLADDRSQPQAALWRH
ncbi:pentatricopeptide repeat-containing protein At2g13600 [Cryptomeria japonica]|uniref:pentatricopeptide repeat-containing protein At2g13600 n=1 Tax=Cryptomeria japonica TaxID=3369 RepID=UPI0027DAAAFE|nr:pentatricopeptide repeat-containing protein At2g13600 [Cryptomeria japonica]